MLEIKNLQASINKKSILKGLNLKIKSGELHAIMGPNGSGKSTLANVLSGKNGYEISGEIIYKGENLKNMSVDGSLVKRGVINNLKEINELPSLPQTRKELELIGGNFQTSNMHLYLGEDATEKNLKAVDLAKIDIIAFATHALSTNVNSNINEPALILTPVSVTDKANDGILTASDINNLKLNADLVILSACDTANTALDNYQAYTGLAQSFFFAGTKSVLATHWEVETNSAVEITSGLISNLKKNEEISYSQALRRSVLDLIENNEKYQHPFYWAPFLIVGNN